MTDEQNIIETTHGKITGKELFRVQGVEMGWQGSELEARDIARRVRNASAKPRLQQGRADGVAADETINKHI